LFQIAFLLFNIVAISAEPLLGLRVQTQWNGYSPEKEIQGIDDLENEPGRKEIIGYEVTYDFSPADRKNIGMENMKEQEFTASDNDMNVAAKTIIDDYKKRHQVAPSHTEIKDAKYSVVFVDLTGLEVVKLMDAALTGEFYPKLITGQRKIDRNYPKVLADITIKGIGQMLGESCPDLLERHFKDEAEKDLTEWAIGTKKFSDILQQCVEGGITESNALAFAESRDTNGDKEITYPELRKLRGITRSAIVTYKSKKDAPAAEEQPAGAQPAGAQPAEEQPSGQ